MIAGGRFLHLLSFQMNSKLSVNASSFVLVVSIPIEEATDYAVNNMTQNESIMVLCAFNLFNKDMVKFHIEAKSRKALVWQYPELPVDAFKPNFNVTQLILICKYMSYFT